MHMKYIDSCSWKDTILLYGSGTQTRPSFLLQHEPGAKAYGCKQKHMYKFVKAREPDKEFINNSV